MTRSEERDLTDRAQRIMTVVALPTLFPLLRPDCRNFDRWANRLARRGPAILDGDSQALADEGIASLSRPECNRIEREPRQLLGERWDELVADLERRSPAKALLAGAVTAGLRERLGLQWSRVELLEQDPDTFEPDPAGALALVLDPQDLWGPPEVEAAAATLGTLPTEDLADDDVWYSVIHECAGELVSPWHERRLRKLVGYVRFQVPLPDMPRASALLAQACSSFKCDRQLRTRLPGLLLADAL